MYLIYQKKIKGRGQNKTNLSNKMEGKIIGTG